MSRRNARLLALLAILVLLTPLIAACGGGTGTNNQANTGQAATPTEGEGTTGDVTATEPAEDTSATEPTEATGDTAATQTPEAVATIPDQGEGRPAGEETAMAAATVSVEETAGPEATAIGEKLDLANLSPDIPDPEQPVTITFASWVGEGLKPFKARFEKLHPNIKIKLQDVPAEQMQDKLTTQIAGGNAPDAAFVDNGTVSAFGTRNALVNLDPYIAKSAAVKPDDYVDAFRKAATVKGSMYGLPFDGESTGLFYRTDLFEQAGIDGPPETWEEFMEAAKKLTNKEKKQYGFAVFAPEATYYWYPWYWQTGARLISEDGKQIAFNGEEGKRAAEFYVDLARNYSPPDLLNSNSWDGRVAFGNGKVGMYVAGAWFAGTLLDEYPKIKGKWATAPLPKDKQCATTIAGDSLIVFEQSKNKDAAWKWIEFLSAPQNVALWNVGTKQNPGSLLPTRKSLLNDPQVFANNPILQGFAQQMECGVSDPAFDNEQWYQIEEALTENLGKAIYGDIEAADAMDEAALAGQDILDAQE